MPVQVGDAVLNFIGDSSQLELAFDKVETMAAAKMAPAVAAVDQVGKSFEIAGEKGQAAATVVSAAWQRVAQATVANTAAQKALSQALDAVKKSGGDDVVAMLALAQAQQNAAKAAAELAVAQKAVGESGRQNFGEARGEMMLLNKELKLGLDRHLTGWLARLPGIGAAMSAAFGVTAVFVLIGLLGEGVSKLIEMSEKSELLRQAWAKLDSDFRDNSVHIQGEIDTQGEKFIALTKGPVAALDFAFQHLKSSAEDMLKTIVTELEAVGTQLSAQGHWYDFGLGFTKAGQEINKFKTDLVAAMHAAADNNPGDVTAAYREGVRKSDEELKRLQEDIDIVKAKNEAAMKAVSDNAPIILSTEALERQLKAVQDVRNQMQAGLKLDQQLTDNAALEAKKAAQQHALEIGTAEINVQKNNRAARLALDLEFSKIQYEQGKIAYAQLLQAEIDNANGIYQADKAALEAHLKLLAADPVKNEAAIKEANGQLQAINIQHQQKLLEIDQQGFTQRVAQQQHGLDLIIAGTKQGTQERVDAENNLATFLRVKLGEENDAYKNQLNKLLEARRAFDQVQRQLNVEDARQTLTLALDKSTAANQYYQYLAQTARISATTLRNLQQQQADADFKLKVQELTKERDILLPEQVAERKVLNDKIALLNQQAEERRKLVAVQTNDAIEDSLNQLGVKSEIMLKRQSDLAQEAFEKIKDSGTASYTELLEAQIKVTEATIAWKQANAQSTTAEQNALIKLTNQYHQLGLALGFVTNQGKLTATLMKALGVDAKLMGTTTQNASLLAVGALSSMFQTWAQGGVTVAQAAAKITEAILSSLAQYAFAKATEQLALGFAALSPTSPDFGHSGEHFTSAALWFAAGAATSIAGGLIANATSGGGSSATGNTSTGTSVTSSSATAGPAPQNPVQTVNLQHFARGGLISSPTLAVIGDNISGSSQSKGEIAASLDDPHAMKSIGEAIAPYLQQSGGHTIHVHVQGLISPDNLGKVMKTISRKVKNNQGTLVSSNSFRVTKRSV